MKLHSGIFMTGNPLLLLSAMLELVGVQFISMGLLGELLTRTYFESQGKTPYAVRTTLNLDRAGAAAGGVIAKSDGSSARAGVPDVAGLDWPPARLGVLTRLGSAL